MSLQLGVSISGTCQPMATDRDNVATLACAATLTNNTDEVQYVAAAGTVPGQTINLQLVELTLPPGASYSLPPPPTGGIWVIATSSAGSLEAREVLHAIGEGALWGLAVIGALDLGIALYHLAKGA